MGPHPFFFIAIVVLPYVLIAAALLWAIRLAYVSKKPARPLFLYPLVGSFIVTLAFVAWGQHDIFTSRSSTAAIGLIFLPFYSVSVALIGFLVSGSVIYIFRFALERVGNVTPRLTSIVPLVGSVLILSLSALTVQSRISRHQLLAAAKSDTSTESVINQAIAAHDLQVLAALAKNPNTSATDLLRIYETCKGQVGVANSREYIVLDALSGNSKTPPDVLAALSHCQETSIRVALGINPSTPVEILPMLAGDKEAMVRTWVTVNPGISKELLLKLADDNDKTVRGYAQSSLRRRGFAEKPVDEEKPDDAAIQNMMDLGRRAASGDIKAVDEIEEQHRQIYEGVDLKNNRAKAISNLKLMRAAFDIVGTEAAKNSEAMKALEYANVKQSLRPFTVDAFGLAAAAGNRQALDALLNYKSHGWLLSSTVAAMKYPADKNQTQAIDFLIAVLDNPQDRPLHHMARQGLEGAAANGNGNAKVALAEHPKE
jgi:hypothetical protein